MLQTNIVNVNFHKLHKPENIQNLLLPQLLRHKVQHVDKSETPFDIRLNNHGSDFSWSKCYLYMSNHSFNRNKKLILIKSLK